MSKARQEMVDRYNALVAEAKLAAKSEDADPEAIKELRLKAQKQAALINEFDEINNMMGTGTETKGNPSPGRPVLPGTNADAAKSGLLDIPGVGNGGAQPEEPKPEPVTKSAYILRFGEAEKAVDQILSELYDGNHEEAYWGQKRAFGRYLRSRSDTDMELSDMKLLKQVVFTPDLVRATLGRGIDDVSILKATMVESIDQLGGFAVPVDFQSRVIERIRGFTVVRERAQVDQTSRDKVEIPMSTGGNDQYSSAVRVSWVDETPADPGNTNLTMGMESIPIHTSMAETDLSRNFVEDAAFDIEGFLVRKFGESAAIDEDNKLLIGSGIGTLQGILPGSSNLLSLTEVASGSTSAITWDGLIAMRYGIASQYRQNAVWVGNRSVYEAIMKLKNSSNQYLWEPFQYSGGQNDAPPRLLGFETMEQEAMPDIATNAYPLIFGDLNAVQIFDRVGMTLERYLDSSTATKNQIKYVMRRRLGAQVVEPWRLCVMKIASS